MATHYDAFISYRHTPLDSRIAGLVQRKLERAHIPKAIRQQTGKKRIQRIFRDKEELPISSDINDNITQALENSDYLIVICSPDTADSIWVQREIEVFLKTHEKDKVLTVLAGGEPQDVIPKILQYREVETVDETGQVIRTQVPAEPLSCDFREYPRKRKEEFPRLLAAMLDCTYDDLRQRQRRRQRRQILAAFLAVLVLVSTIAVYALDRAARIQQEARNTQIAQSRYLAQVSGDLLQSGQRETAIQIALAALPNETDPDRPLVSDALYALNNAMYTYRQASFNQFVPDGSTAMPSDIWWETRSPNGTRWMTMDYDYTLRVHDLTTGEILAMMTKDEMYARFSDSTYPRTVFRSETEVLLFFTNCCGCWDLEQNTILWSAEYATASVRCAADPNTRIGYGVYLTEGNLNIHIIDPDGNLSTMEVPIAEEHDGFLQDVLLSPDAAQLAVRIQTMVETEYQDILVLVDLATGTTSAIVPALPTICTMYYPGDGHIYLISSDFDPYNVKHYNYGVNCCDIATGETLWTHTGQQYIVRDYHDYSALQGRLRLETMLAGDEPELRPILVAGIGNRVSIIDPTDGTGITYAEFPSEILTIDYYSRDRVFLALKDGSIVQYILDSDLIAEVGNINTDVSRAVYLPEHGQYTLLTSDPDSLIRLSNRLSDDSGTLLQTEYPVIAVYYLDTAEQQIRAVCERDTEDTTQYRLQFYRLHETSPYAASDWFSGSPISISTDQNADTPTVYWLCQSEVPQLIGWDLSSNTPHCQIQLAENYLSGVELIGITGEKAYIQCMDGIMLVDTATGEVTARETSNYLYTAVFSPDQTQIFLLREKYDYGRLLLERIDVAALMDPEAETQLVAELSKSISTATLPAFSEDGTLLACAAGDAYQVIDLTGATLYPPIPVTCFSRSSAAFLSDHVLAVCGDNGYLSTWDLTTGEMIMEDQHLSNANSIFTNHDILYVQDDTNGMHLYRVAEDGTFAREISVELGLFSGDGTEICMLNNHGEATCYPVYTVAELTAKAWALIDGQPLSEADQIKYFIDG